MTRHAHDRVLSVPARQLDIGLPFERIRDPAKFIGTQYRAARMRYRYISRLLTARVLMVSQLRLCVEPIFYDK